MGLECHVDEFLSRRPLVQSIGGLFYLKRSPAPVKLPREYTPELCRIVGIMHGDGNMSGRRILVTDSLKDYHIFVVQPLFMGLFNVKLNLFQDRNRNSYYSHTKNSLLYDYFTEVLEIPKGSVRSSLKLPSYIESFSDESKAAYIGGLYDSEGSIKSRQAEIDFSITCRSISDFISKFLKEQGIGISTPVRNRLGRDTEYEIRIYGRDDLKRFSEVITFLHPDKNKKLSNYL